MSDNVHGHQKPAPFRTNPDNPIFARHQPEIVPSDIPQGLHGAPALRSELTTAEATDVPQPHGDPSPAPAIEDLGALEDSQAAVLDPSDEDEETVTQETTADSEDEDEEVQSAG